MLQSCAESQQDIDDIQMVDQVSSNYKLKKAKACFDSYFNNKSKLVDLNIIEQYFDTKLKKYPTNRQIWSISRQVYRQNHQKHWSQIQFNLLMWTIAKYCSIHDIHITQLQTPDYAQISNVFLDKQVEDIRKKLIIVAKANDRPFSGFEDELIVQMQQENHISLWPSIATQILIQFNIWRSPRQIRDHWCQHLDPSLIQQHQLWTQQEELQLLELYREHRNKYVIISKILSRNDYQIKNKITQLLGRGNHTEELIVNVIDKLRILLNKEPIYVNQDNSRYIRANNQQISIEQARTFTPVLCSVVDYKIYFCDTLLVQKKISENQLEDIDVDKQDYDQYSIFQSRLFF